MRVTLPRLLVLALIPIFALTACFPIFRKQDWDQIYSDVSHPFNESYSAPFICGNAADVAERAFDLKQQGVPEATARSTIFREMLTQSYAQVAFSRVYAGEFAARSDARYEIFQSCMAQGKD